MFVTYLWRAVGHKVIPHKGEFSNRCIHHRRERALPILGNDDISAPRDCLSECPTLDLLDALIYREGHAVARDGWVKDDKGIREFCVHAIERLDELE